MKRISSRQGHPYSIRDKEQALLLLDQNGKNFKKVAEEIGVTIMTLRNWRNEAIRNLPISMTEEMEKFIKDTWKNIHSLNNPEFIEDLKAQALKKGNIKEIFAGISILVDKMTTLTRLKEKAAKEAESVEEENLTEEEIERQIAEEEKKKRKK